MSCIDAFANWGSVRQAAFGSADNASALDGTYVCQQQVMDALAAYVAACGSNASTQTNDYSGPQSLQTFCMQRKGIQLSVPVVSNPPAPSPDPPVQPSPNQPVPTTAAPQPSQQPQPVQPVPSQNSAQPVQPVQPIQPTQGSSQPDQPNQPAPTTAGAGSGQPQSTAAGAIRSSDASNNRNTVSFNNGVAGVQTSTLRFGGNTASPTTAASIGSSSGQSSSMGLLLGVGVAMIVVLVIVGLVIRRRRQPDIVVPMPTISLEHQNQPYSNTHNYTSNTPATSSISQPQIRLIPSPSDVIRSSGQYSSEKTPFNAPPSSIGDDRSSNWESFAAPIVAPAPALYLDEKSSMMNAVYAARSTPTNSSSRQRDSLLSDGSNVQRFNTVASHAVSADRSSVSLPPVPTSSDPNEWSVAEVEAWARALPHFGDKLGNVMLEYRINGRVLMGLTRDTMKDELGLVFGEVTQLEAYIAQLRGELLVQEEGLPPSYDA
ncbi:hypothetical protein HDU80_011000 [Chytriomyces hyalinus]|nr:hypothetical protein HDU80_011000 [Chytriomyces hyalinus]